MIRSLRSPARLLFLAALLAAAIAPAAAATTDWLQSKGARVRIVATRPGADGTIRAAVEIDLKAGWTTYWRDPGGSGIPPQLTTEGSRNVKSVRLQFPPPVALDEGGVAAVGYDAPVALPLTIRQGVPGKDSLLHARLFIGVCKEICIPVNADFSLDIPSSESPANSIASVMVAGAFASLPGPEDDSFAVGKAELSKDGHRVTVTARLPGSTPGGAPPQLFVAGPAGWSFAPARLQQRSGGSATFVVPVAARPDTLRDDTRLILVVRDGERSIETEKTLQ